MKRIISYLIVSLVMFFMVTKVNAVSILESGEAVNQKGEYDSSRFVFGNVVNSNASVEGISLAAGNEIGIKGKTSYGVYFGNVINIDGNVEKDLFIAGNSIRLSDDAVIGRDVYIAGNNVIINTDIPRDLRIGANNVNLSGISIGGDVYVFADKVILDEKTVITGKLTVAEDSVVVGEDDAKIGSIKREKDSSVKENINPINNVVSFVISVVGAFIVMIVLFYFVPGTKERLDNVCFDIKVVIRDICFGLVLLIVIPIVTFFAIFTGFLTPLAIITVCVYGISIYLSSLLVCYIIGRVISNKYLNKDNKYLSLIIGILLFKILKLIPVINGVVTTLVILYGVGLIGNYIRKVEK